MTPQDTTIIDDKDGESEDAKLFEKCVYWTQDEIDCYNAAIDHAVKVVDELRRPYYGPHSEYLIQKLNSLKK